MVEKTKEKTICRKRHVSNKDHNVEPLFCEFCKDYVEVKQGNFCTCCGKHIDKIETWIEARKIYNKFMTRYGPLIERLENDIELQQLLIQFPMFMKVKHGMWEYVIEPKNIMKFVHIATMDRTLFPAPFPECDTKGKQLKDRQSCTFEDNTDHKMKKYNKYNSMMEILSGRLAPLFK